MTRLRHALLVSVPALVLASCADTAPAPAETKPAETAERAPEKKPYKKPPRMNNRGEIGSISLSEVFSLQQSGQAMIFDARPAFFFGLGHLPGAINISAHGDMDTAIHKREKEIEAALAAGRTLVVYCTSPTCPDARTLARHLSGFGYPSSIFSGGWDEWKEAGLPTE